MRTLSEKLQLTTSIDFKLFYKQNQKFNPILIDGCLFNNMVKIHYCPDPHLKHQNKQIVLQLKPSGNLVCQWCMFVGYDENGELKAGFRPDQYKK